MKIIYILGFIPLSLFVIPFYLITKNFKLKRIFFFIQVILLFNQIICTLIYYSYK